MAAKKAMATAHPIAIQEGRGPKRKAIDSHSQMKGYVFPKLTPEQSRQLDVKLLRLIVMTGSPFAMVDNPYFVDFVHTLRGNCNLPGEIYHREGKLVDVRSVVSNSQPYKWLFHLQQMIYCMSKYNRF